MKLEHVILNNKSKTWPVHVTLRFSYFSILILWLDPSLDFIYIYIWDNILINLQFILI
jgi:hypothetical protein